MTHPTAPSARPDHPIPCSSLGLAAGLALLVSACAGPRAVPPTDWLPDSDGWQVRDLDPREPPQWVLYERDASIAEVKEIRIVGVVDAEPEAVARALRHRLLDDANLPKGMQRTILRESETEVEYHALNPMPFPFDDREVNERLRFTHHPGTGVYAVEARSVDPGEPAKPGVLRIPVVQNRFVIAPAGAGRSAVTIDTVHDLGGHFPNWMIYGPMSDYLVAELAWLNAFTAPAQSASR